MADVKISGLPASTVPLAGTEVLPIVQSGVTKKVAVSDLTAGRAVSAASLALTTTPLPVTSGGTGLATLTAGYVPYGNGTGAIASSANLNFGTTFLNVVGPAISWNTAFNGVQTAACSIASLTNDAFFLGNAYYDSVGWKYIASKPAGMYTMGNTTAGEHSWSTAPSGTAGGALTWTERMRIHNSGGVSIGNTTDPGAGNVSASSFIPRAAPNTAWGIDFPSGSGSYVSIANGATYDLASGSGVIYIWDDGGNGVGVFYTYYGAVNINFQNAALYTNISGTPATVNVFFNAGTGKYRIQNNFGSTLNFYISTIKLRASV
jgi:hypothetical protein